MLLHFLVSDALYMTPSKVNQMHPIKNQKSANPLKWYIGDLLKLLARWQLQWFDQALGQQKAKADTKEESHALSILENIRIATNI